MIRQNRIYGIKDVITFRASKRIPSECRIRTATTGVAVGGGTIVAIVSCIVGSCGGTAVDS